MKTLLCLALSVLLLLTGCTNNQVITDLTLAVDALEIALPLIGPSAHLPPDLEAQIQAYLGATSQAITQASDILAGAGTDAQKAAAITAAFAGIAQPLIPPQYAGIGAAVAQVASLVSKFLGSLPATKVAAEAVSARTVAMPGANAKTTALSKGDISKLAKVKARAALVHERSH